MQGPLPLKLHIYCFPLPPYTSCPHEQRKAICEILMTLCLAMGTPFCTLVKRGMSVILCSVPKALNISLYSAVKMEQQGRKAIVSNLNKGHISYLCKVQVHCHNVTPIQLSVKSCFRNTPFIFSSWMTVTSIMASSQPLVGAQCIEHNLAVFGPFHMGASLEQILLTREIALLITTEQADDRSCPLHCAEQTVALSSMGKSDGNRPPVCFHPIHWTDRK